MYENVYFIHRTYFYLVLIKKWLSLQVSSPKSFAIDYIDDPASSKFGVFDTLSCGSDKHNKLNNEI